MQFGVVSFRTQSQNGFPVSFGVKSDPVPVLRDSFRVGVPTAGYWEEIFNSDAKDYGGLGFGNCGGLESEPIEWDGRPHSLCLQLPPHSVSVFRLKR